MNPFPLSGSRAAFFRLAALALLAPSLHAQTRYAIEDLGPIGSGVPVDPMAVFGINNAGQVACFNSPSSGTFVGVRYSGFSLTNIAPLSSDPSSKAIAINNAGFIVGESGTPSSSTSPFFTSSTTRLFLSSNGAIQALPISNPRVFGLNNSGQIVGDSTSRAFIYSNGTVQTLPTIGTGSSNRANAINDSGQVAGWSNVNTTDRHAFLYSAGTMKDLGTLGGATSQAQGINATGQVVGYGLTNSGETHGFLYTSGTMKDLGLPNGWTETRAYGINSSGQIVGWGRLSSASTHPFLYANGAFTDLTSVFPVRVPGSNGFTSISYAAAINDAGQITGIGNYFDSGTTSTLHAFVLTPVPDIQPLDTLAAAGSTVRFDTTATTLPGATYQWSRNGVALPGATQSSLLLSKVTTGDSGSYTCSVSNDHARATTAAALLGVSAALSPGRLVNLSIRTLAGSGSQTLIVGFAIGGSGTFGAKPVLIRAVGPTLAGFGVSGTLADPTLSVVAQGSSTPIATNDDWGGSAQLSSLASAVGAFPLGDAASKDAVVSTGPVAGSYSALIGGKAGTTGIALAEIYDASPASTVTGTTPRLVNVSARSQVGTGDQGLFAGFFIGGSAARTVLIRAIGPTLASYGVTDALADPQLQLFRGSTLLAANDNWGGSAQLAALGDSVGAFQLPNKDSKDSILVATLAPGLYSAQVTGVGNTTGVALVEIYELP